MKFISLNKAIVYHFLLDHIRFFFNKLCIDFHPASGGCKNCPDLISSFEERGFHRIQPNIEIDVVYTWVDGSDEEHIRKRSMFQENQDRLHENATSKARFRDNDELRYSLRSLETYAPWVRNVILVTDSQCPEWININHPKLRIVDHKEFIPEEYLPTFNSHVIEAYLHNIPQLSEHFIYLNDDVFLGRLCKKTDFFTSNGLPLAFVDWRKRRRVGYSYTKTPHAMSYFNTLQFLNEHHVSTDPKFITAHGPYAQTVTNARGAFEFYKDYIEQFSKNRFRTTQEIAMYCHALPFWAYAKKKIVPCDERYYYVQAIRKDRLAYYKGILNSKKDHTPPLFFCINDVGKADNYNNWKQDLLNLLREYYPTPSSFE